MDGLWNEPRIHRLRGGTFRYKAELAVTHPLVVVQERSNVGPNAGIRPQPRSCKKVYQNGLPGATLALEWRSTAALPRESKEETLEQAPAARHRLVKLCIEELISNEFAL